MTHPYKIALELKYKGFPTRLNFFTCLFSPEEAGVAVGEPGIGVPQERRERSQKKNECKENYWYGPNFGLMWPRKFKSISFASSD